MKQMGFGLVRQARTNPVAAACIHHDVEVWRNGGRDLRTFASLGLLSHEDDWAFLPRNLDGSP